MRYRQSDVHRCGLVLLLLGSSLFSGIATAQETLGATSAAVPDDPFGRGTPRQTADGFVTAINESDYERAAEFIDVRNLFGEAASIPPAELARQLSVITRRATWIEIAEFSDSPNGHANDDLPPYRDLIGVVQLGEEKAELYFQQVPRDDGVFIWKVSNATVSQIPNLYRTHGYPPWVESIRQSVPEVSFVGFELFKWLIVIAVCVATYLGVLIFAYLLRRAGRNRDTVGRKRLFRYLTVPVALWLVILAMSGTAVALGRGPVVETFQMYSPIPTLLTLWVLLSGLSLFRDVQGDRLTELGRPGAALVLRPMTNALKVLAVIAAILFYLNQIGVNITTVLAGLGVGGLAVALALQRPLEDLMGAITLYSQQPIRVGDFCRIGNETGTIEEIGLRTTRIRTLADTVIAVPNSKLAAEAIDNISARKKIRYRTELRLQYDSSREQITSVLSGVRQLLEDDDRVHQDNPRVRFKEIGEDALIVEINCYLDTVDWAGFLEIAEDLNLKILEIVQTAGTSLALPTQTLRIEGETPLDA